MHNSQLPIKHQETLLSTDVEALRVTSSFAAFAPKSDVLSASLLAWPTLLQLTIPLAKFVGNNTGSETTKVTFFFANKGFHPCMGIEPNV